MKPFRRLAIVAITSLFRLVLFFGLSIMAALPLFGSPDHLEHTLVATNSYANFVPAILQSLGSASQGNGGIPFTDDGVKKIVTDAFPPSLIQQSSETIIGSTYDWLGGKTPRLTFRIDITKNRNGMTENITNYAFDHIADLPVCTTNPPTVDPFSATCLPSNFSIANERAAYTQAINGLLPKTVFTANDLPAFSGGKKLASDFPHAPQYYRWLLLTPWIVISTILLLSAALLFLCSSRRRGFRLIGSVTLSSGVALLVTPILYILVYPRISNAVRLQSANQGINVLLDTLIQNLSHSFYDYLIKAALLVVNIGLAMLLAERLSRPNPYATVEANAGLVSGNTPKRYTSDRGLAIDSVPLQSSEQTAQPKHTKRRRSTLEEEF